jgi:leader peptidase (prepilin peptidase)/N-methyltransferase
VRAGELLGARWIAEEGAESSPRWPIMPSFIAAAALGMGSAGAAFWALDGTMTYAAIALAQVFLFAAACDLKSKLIPDIASIAAAALGLAIALATSGIAQAAAALASGVIAGGTLYAIGYLASKRSGRTALGLGDVKVTAAGGMLVGPVHVWTAIGAAAVATLLAVLVRAALRGAKVPRDLEIPLGPGLMAAIYVAWILTVNA